MGFGHPGLPGRAARRHVEGESGTGPAFALIQSQVVVEKFVSALMPVRGQLAL